MTYESRITNGFQRNNSDNGLVRQLYELVVFVKNRSEMRENQQRTLEENNELKRRLEMMEEELDIMRIEQEVVYEQQKQEEKQKQFLESEFRKDALLEEDRQFATHLVTEIWRGNEKASGDLMVVDSVRTDCQDDLYDISSSGL